MQSIYSYHQYHSTHSHGHSTHSHHGGRSRRTPRLPGHGGHNKPFRDFHHRQRNAKEIMEAAHVTAFRRDFEAARSFDLEDDEIFCPFNLLTEDDLQSIHSGGSDRSSLSSGSPDSSPLQHQIQPTPNVVLSSSASSYGSNGYSSSTKLHQPLAQRTRNAIPIVDPTTRTVASPPQSVSPSRQIQQQFLSRRW